MKWMIASDIHGSAFYCRQLLEAYRREAPGRLLLLGDLLYHGPRNALPEEYDPKAVIAMLNPLKREILCVRGNCDTEVDQMVLEFPILADYCILDLGDRILFATHGHHFSAQNLPPLKAGDLFLQGHTHVPGHTEQDGIYCLNPGSVSIPKENSWHGYMTLENGELCWKDLEGQQKDRLCL
ncbi:MAG: phosphodiesterase [Eubacteriales bacterium]|nr:phosphodiesterase [Eubacteriales bacterium]